MIGGSVVSSILGLQYTIGELMNIDAARQSKAKQCKVSLVKVYHELQKDSSLDRLRKFFKIKSPTVKAYLVVFKFEVRSDSGNRHKVFIRTNPDFSYQNWSSNRVSIYCDCKDFKYRTAYVLGQRNSVFLTPRISKALSESIGKAPQRVSPTLLCKHSFAALSWLMTNYQKVMKSV